MLLQVNYRNFLGEKVMETWVRNSIRTNHGRHHYRLSANGRIVIIVLPISSFTEFILYINKHLILYIFM